MLATIEGPDVLIVVGIVVLLFGLRRFPAIARSLGAARTELWRGIEDEATDPASGTALLAALSASAITPSKRPAPTDRHPGVVGNERPGRTEA